MGWINWLENLPSFAIKKLGGSCILCPFYEPISQKFNSKYGRGVLDFSQPQWGHIEKYWGSRLLGQKPHGNSNHEDRDSFKSSKQICSLAGEQTRCFALFMDLWGKESWWHTYLIISHKIRHDFRRDHVVFFHVHGKFDVIGSFTKLMTEKWMFITPILSNTDLTSLAPRATTFVWNPQWTPKFRNVAGVVLHQLHPNNSWVLPRIPRIPRFDMS